MKDYSNYLTYLEIKEKYNLARTTIVNRCDKLGIIPIELRKATYRGRCPMGIHKDDIKKIVEYGVIVRKGVARLRDVAADMGINQNTAMAWCREIGVKIHKDNIGSGKTNLIKITDIPKLKHRQQNKPAVINRMKAGDYNRDHGLYHRICEDYTLLRSVV